MKIVTGVDFSETSASAASYALQLAADLDAELHIIHVTDADTNSRARIKSSMLEEKIRELAEEDLNEFCAGLLKTDKVHPPVTCKVIGGHEAGSAIQQYAKSVNAYCVIVGTTGATGMKSVFLGKHALKVINESEIPVLAIPSGTVYKGIQRVLYAFDLGHTDDNVSSLNQFVERLGAKLELLHVRTPGEEWTDQDVAAIASRFSSQPLIHELEVDINDSKVVNARIAGFIERGKADLLVLYHRHRGFFSQLFSQGHTADMLEKKVPLMVFRKSTS